MLWNMMSQGRQSLLEWRQKRTLREMLNDPRSAKGCRSIGQLEKGIAADRATTERLLLAIGARHGGINGTMDVGPARRRLTRVDVRRAAAGGNGSNVGTALRPHVREALLAIAAANS